MTIIIIVNDNDKTRITIFPGDLFRLNNVSSSTTEKVHEEGGLTHVTPSIKHYNLAHTHTHQFSSSKAPYWLATNNLITESISVVHNSIREQIFSYLSPFSLI